MVVHGNLDRRDFLTAGVGTVTMAFAGCTRILADDSASATVEWTTRIPRVTGSLAVADGTVYACTEFGLYTIEAETGERGWEFSSGQGKAITRPVLIDETVLFGTSGRSRVLYAITMAGEADWSVDFPSGVTTSAVADGTVYAASGVMGGEFGLYALDAETGDSDWHVALPDHQVGSSPTVAGETVYIESGGFAAFDAGTGELQWREEREQTEVGESARHHPVVGDGVVYFSHSMESEVHALDATTGEREWMAETNARASTPAIDDETLYVGTTDSAPRGTTGRLYALDVETGDERWSVVVDDVPLEGPFVGDGTVYTAGHDTLYAIEADEGEIEWEYEFENGITAPVSDSERLYVTTPRPETSSFEVYALSQ